MKFFVDNCLPPRVATALVALEDTVVVQHLKQRFPEGADDVEWMGQLAKEGQWVIISRDELYKDPVEKEALRQAGHVLFFLSKGWAHLPLWELASKLFHWWPRIVDEASRARPGNCFTVPPKGGKLPKFRLT